MNPATSHNLRHADRLRIGDKLYDLRRRVLVMGVVNVTPDSFSDGGKWLEPKAAISHAYRHIEEGADLIDIGAESTRPGAKRIDASEEISRLAPVLEELCKNSPIPISVDTSKLEMARAACDLGVKVINDVRGLRDRDDRGNPVLAKLAAECGGAVIVMHMLGEPAHMQENPQYQDVVREVGEYLEEAASRAVKCGVPRESVVVDPGIGFGKTLEHNLQLLRNTDQLAARGFPVLIGVSRKRMFEKLLGLPVDQRLEAGLAAGVLTALKGARLLRTHDVQATVRAIRVVESLI